jgi:hypothetical protein
MGVSPSSLLWQTLPLKRGEPLSTATHDSGRLIRHIISMKQISFLKSGLLALSLAGFLAAGSTASAQLRSFTGYDSQTLPANDDGSTGLVNLGFTADFYGTNYSQTYVNNNGNITFDSALATYTPFGLTGTGHVIIAPFFGDVDTRSVGSTPTTYGSGVLGGHNAFAVNWFHVGDYNELQIFNTFQLVLIDRSDIAAGDFDFEFNYTQINWETGQASGGNSLGLGGSPARVGYSSGGTTPTSFELAGSGITLSFLDSNTVTGLIYNSLGTPFDGASLNGRYDFSVRNGVVQPPITNGAVPEPSTYGMIGAGVLLIGALLRRRFAKS